MAYPETVQKLLDRGVVMPCPASVEVDPAVAPERVAPGVVIHAGCRLRGAATSIGPGSELGAEAPATVENCRLGRKVALKGGYFAGSTFLDGANVGSGAHIRAGTLLEEEAGGAHAVGLKQTVFLPFVTAGSLINFCDALMAGGTDRKNHSEIGSSYIHFNFTPHQDKATPSLVGDVPRGVMLDQPPIFLGGQGGLVGPVRIAYGTIISAGTIHRKDVVEPGLLIAGSPRSAATASAYDARMYRAIDRVVKSNLVYIGNIRALLGWYHAARRPLMERDPFSRACLEGAEECLETILKERIQRLGELAGKMPDSVRRGRAAGLPETVLASQEALASGWAGLKARIEGGGAEEAGRAERERFLAAWKPGGSYPDSIRALDPEYRRAGTAWLDAVVESVAALWPLGPGG